MATKHVVSIRGASSDVTLTGQEVAARAQDAAKWATKGPAQKAAAELKEARTAALEAILDDMAGDARFDNLPEVAQYRSRRP